VVNDLLESELEGYPTHGIARLIEYVSAIKTGTIVPYEKPAISFASTTARNIDGRRCFGTLAAKRVVTELTNLLLDNSIAVVGLANTNHLGRLAHIGRRLAEQGLLVLGF